MALLRVLRWLFVAVLIIGLPIFIYLGFIADDPILDVEYDVDLGRQSVASFAEDTTMIMLAPEEYPEAYRHLERIVQEVVKSQEIEYGELFAYDSVRIIDDDETLNAFCLPGGFIYVYTGLIKYLDAEDHLAGVLGHEIAHAELRHSSIRLQREYGRQRLLELIVLTAPSAGTVASAAILKELTSLSYSRDQEAASDDMSVRYLNGSSYACDGTAGFFVKLLEQGADVGIPAYLSSHPDSEARVSDIRARAGNLGCSTALGDQSNWQAFKASLPGEPLADSD
jgi:predicted Zn-dependent protease